MSSFHSIRSFISQSGGPVLISIIIPTLYESGNLPRLQTALGDLRDCEIIVADGGSRDGTLSVANALGWKTTVTEPGRGIQMREAAKHAAGQWLWFLHADSRPPANWRVLAEERPAAAAFTLAIDASGLNYRLIELGARARTWLDQIPYGDQSMWISRSLYDSLGGMPPVPLFEDVLLARAAKKAGTPFRIFPQTISTDARRWQKDGPWLRTLENWRYRLAFERGLSPEALYQQYHSDKQT